jgi:hypothetical protein
MHFMYRLMQDLHFTKDSSSLHESGLRNILDVMEVLEIMYTKKLFHEITS